MSESSLPLVRAVRGMSGTRRFLVLGAAAVSAQTTKTAEGGPYQRQIATIGPDSKTGQITAQTVADTRPGRMVYDPGHPDANADGFVEYPNIDISTELVDLMVARRVHEANVSVFQAAKTMLRRALDI